MNWNPNRRFNDPRWNASLWLAGFERAKKFGIGYADFRAQVFQNTISAIDARGFRLEEDFLFDSKDSVVSRTVFNESPSPIVTKRSRKKTSVKVSNTDCLIATLKLSNQKLNPAVLNMANGSNPGGGVLYGAGGQEENIFRRSNLFVSLYQFAPYHDEYGVPKNNEHAYPLDEKTGGTYSPGITVFRGLEQEGYPYLKSPFKVNIISVPAICRPELQKLRNGELRIADKFLEPVRMKIRTILRIALAHGHDSLVLSAFGCGAFRNPPKHMAKLFKEVLNEDEFINRFRKIVFAIVEDHNSRREHNPQGNLKPFMEVFGSASAGV